MGLPISAMTGAFDRGERRRLGMLFALIGALHVAGWGLLFAYGSGHPELVALGSVAYFFGLRHAFDADHISAIDNTTRKLLQERRRPMAVGFFFSLGHSTVVFLITLALGLAVSWLVSGVVDGNGQLRSLGSLVGTSVSGSFLLLIGVLNLVILLDIVRVYRRMRRGEYDRGTLHHELVGGGLMSRLFGRLFGLIRHSWQMYPIGFLFGLGFDTASEVALLAISASAAARGMPLIAILSLPLIFAAGMSMMDTADGAFMAKAYGWAFSNPVRRVFYNLTVTGLSVFVALFVGGVELSQIAARELHLDGQPWAALAGLDLGLLGFLIVGAFVATWAVAFAVYRFRRVEERWSAMVAGD